MKAILITLFFVTLSIGQTLGSRYTHTGSIEVLQSVNVDTTFDKRFEEVTFYSISSTFEVKVGAADTSGWAEREWISIPVGMGLTFSYPTYIKRIEFRSSEDNTVYYIGVKNIMQY